MGFHGSLRGGSVGCRSLVTAGDDRVRLVRVVINRPAPAGVRRLDRRRRAFVATNDRRSDKCPHSLESFRNTHASVPHVMGSFRGIFAWNLLMGSHLPSPSAGPRHGPRPRWRRPPSRKGSKRQLKAVEGQGTGSGRSRKGGERSRKGSEKAVNVSGRSRERAVGGQVKAVGGQREAVEGQRKGQWKPAWRGAGPMQPPRPNLLSKTQSYGRGISRRVSTGAPKNSLLRRSVEERKGTLSEALKGGENTHTHTHKEMGRAS